MRTARERIRGHLKDAHKGASNLHLLYRSKLPLNMHLIISVLKQIQCPETVQRTGT